jgi:hypothetical protein
MRLRRIFSPSPIKNLHIRWPSEGEAILLK